MISIFDLLIQKKYKGLTISTLSAYHISSFLTEKEKGHKRQKNIFRHKDIKTKEHKNKRNNKNMYLCTYVKKANKRIKK